MALTFKKAERKQVRIKVGLAGPAGSGKTMSSLLMAYGIVKAEFPTRSEAEVWGKIVVVDTENGSGSLYVGKQVGPTTIGEYNTIDLTPPFDPQIFIDAIHMAENHGMDVIIIDSLSHAWAGAGGALDMQGKAAERTSSWAAWRTVTPLHNKLVDAMLQSPCHVLANRRAKMEYQQTEENGKKAVKAIGMGVVMRDGIEYEFTVSFMLDYNHVASSTKDRTGMFDGKYFTIDANTGKQMYEWLSSGAPAQAEETSVPAPTAAPAAESDEQIQKAVAAVDALIKPLVTAENKAEIVEKIKSIIGQANYKKCTDIEKLRALYKAFS